MVAKLCTPPRGHYTGKISFTNASKIITNWFLTLQPDIFKTISSLPQWAQERAWLEYEHLTPYNLFFYELIYALMSKKEKLY